MQQKMDLETPGIEEAEAGMGKRENPKARMNGKGGVVIIIAK